MTAPRTLTVGVSAALGLALALVPGAAAATGSGNVVELALPRPAADEVVLGRARVEMERFGTQALVIRPSRRRALARLRALRIGLSATGADAAGNAARPARARAVLRR